MANNKSAAKRILINKRNRLQNRFYKSSIKTSIKLFTKHLENYQTSKTLDNKEKVQTVLNSIYSLIDKSCKKKIYHKNKGARQKSKLALKLKASSEY